MKNILLSSDIGQRKKHITTVATKTHPMFAARLLLTFLKTVLGKHIMAEYALGNGNMSDYTHRQQHTIALFNQIFTTRSAESV